MGKRETKESYKDSRNLQTDAGNRYGDLYDQTSDRIGTGSGVENIDNGGMGGISAPSGPTNSYGDSTEEYSFGGDTSRFTGNQYSFTGDDARRGEGSWSPDDQRDFLSQGYGDIYSNIERLKDPDKINVDELKNTLGGYRNFRDTGGLSTENVDRMRGMGGFDEFAKTGGYTAKNIADIKAQALRPIGSFATGTRDELARRQAVQGGYGPGFDAASRQLQRDTARNIAATSLDANVGIQDRINANRQWGIGGLTSAEGALAGMQTGNRLGALAGESGIGTNLSNFNAQDIQNTQNQGMFNIQHALNAKMSGLGGLTGLYEGTMGRQENAYNRDFGAQQNALDRDFQAEQASYGRDFSGTQAGLDRGLTRGESSLNRGFSRGQSDYDRQLAILDSMYRAQLGGLGQQSQLGMQPGIGGNLMNLAGTAAGIGSQFFMPKIPKFSTGMGSTYRDLGGGLY